MHRPVRPNKPLNILLGGILGLAIGALLGSAVGLVLYWRFRTAPHDSAVPPAPRAPDSFGRRMAITALFFVTVPIVLMICSIIYYRLTPGFFNSNGPAARFPFEPPASTSSDQGSSGSEPTTAPATLQIEPAPFDVGHPEPHALYWGFNGFIPPARLACFVFVVWSNGVPTVDPGFSTYFKVGKGGGIDVPFCCLACYRLVETAEFSPLTDTQKSNSLAAWKYPESSGASNAVRWDVNLGAGSTGSRLIAMPPYHLAESTVQRSVHTGYQAVLPLIEFDQPAAAENNGEPATQVRVHDPEKGMHGLLQGENGRSGVELRIFLDLLASSPIRTLPGETDRTNYVVGKGLAWSVEQTLDRIMNVKPDWTFDQDQMVLKNLLRRRNMETNQ